MKATRFLLLLIIGISLNTQVHAQSVKRLNVDCLQAKNAHFKCDVHFDKCPDVPGISFAGQDQAPCSDQNSLWVKTDDPNTLIFTTDGEDNITY